MTAEVVSIAGGASPQSRENAITTLRSFADAIEDGRCTDFVFIGCVEGQFLYRRWCTGLHAVAMTAMANNEAIRELRR